MIAFIKPILAKVFLRQFEKDWNNSESEYEKMTNRFYESPPVPFRGTKLNIEG